jgi:hypothetical protein
MNKLTENDKKYNYYTHRNKVLEYANMNYYKREWEEYKKKMADKKLRDDKEIK